MITEMLFLISSRGRGSDSNTLVLVSPTFRHNLKLTSRGIYRVIQLGTGVTCARTEKE